jgi:hypothetical protein
MLVPARCGVCGSAMRCDPEPKIPPDIVLRLECWKCNVRVIIPATPYLVMGEVVG